MGKASFIDIVLWLALAAMWSSSYAVRTAADRTGHHHRVDLSGHQQIGKACQRTRNPAASGSSASTVNSALPA